MKRECLYCGKNNSGGSGGAKYCDKGPRNDPDGKNSHTWVLSVHSVTIQIDDLHRVYVYGDGRFFIEKCFDGMWSDVTDKSDQAGYPYRRYVEDVLPTAQKLLKGVK